MPRLLRTHAEEEHPQHPVWKRPSLKNNFRGNFVSVIIYVIENAFSTVVNDKELKVSNMNTNQHVKLTNQSLSSTDIISIFMRLRLKAKFWDSNSCCMTDLTLRIRGANYDNKNFYR